jgi:cephalosporin hydroxylase
MLTIDEAHGRVVVSHEDGSAEEHKFDTPEAFEAVSAAWLRCGWDVKYVYGFTWMGRPIIQLPEDIIRMQELVWRLQPDVLIETGVAHGGSLVFYASLFEAMGHGRVIGIDIDIRAHNRTAIEAHRMAKRITLVQGSSTTPGTLTVVHQHIAPDERVMVVLDSNHSCSHVAAELDLYAPIVSPGCYIVACDGIMAQVAGAPRTAPDWTWNNPITAVEAFLVRNPDFVLDEPGFAFNEGAVRNHVTYWPKSYLRRR